ncbi:hypothetical protein C1646_761162 [Rhizophagus diaphanus]|nr:hypothetical protein C1646_761162 [Rhizophagus diaphanus] [Rhizophagus sp. MUCL 43196]
MSNSSLESSLKDTSNVIRLLIEFKHKTLKYVSYNTLPSHIQPVSESELSHLKKAIIKELQKRLKNHHTAVGKQVFSIHCSEDAFVEEKAFDEVGKVLDDKNWGERNYGGEQLSFVRLYTMPESENNSYDQNAKKLKPKLVYNGEITVKWKINVKFKENFINLCN